jgi:uncharacterized protein (TIGR02266 family)
VAIEVTFSGERLEALTRNLSFGGVFVESDARVPFGARVALRFALPTGEVVVDGVVRWLEDGAGQARGFGVRFDGLRARDVWALNKFFAREAK